ncbi:MAG: polyamine ABC transporter substrate-binding protein [Proteobacteria bacterium]|uniref:Putrescine-binding periplasmic protein n=1 Tax=Candidatus Avisuccinivibrio stercorigallinarum TaxID=2840704 RepID=A0A9D9DAL8_9GAMM|nr:polyamine ABC transporter substrate-binding protein [Candidatus Avisuccinivibrio stercorigallinarum]
MSLCTCAAQAADTDNKLYILNWSDYIAPDTIKNFETETGIKVEYVLMDSNEIMEAKLMTGHSGYDIVAPSLHVLKRLSDGGVLEPLDKSKLPNFKHLDKEKLAKIAEIDQDNTYGIPYMELSTGIGYNKQQVAKAMGPDFVPDSWDVLFKPEIVSKINQACGVTVLDSASDMICSTLIYLNRDPQSPHQEDYEEAQKQLAQMIKNVRYIHSSQYVNDLASGEICLSVGWSGDVQLAAQRAKEAGLDDIAYVIPKEGALMGYDMFAIPRDAEHKDNAYKFLDYIMRPEVIAEITNYVRYANANADATPLVNEDIRNNPGIYFAPELLERMHIVVPPASMERTLTRTWNRVRMEAAD